MKPSYTFYRGVYRLVRAYINVIYRFQVIGQENIPEGAAVVCANHSNIIDPFLVAIAFGIHNHMHVIAKIELFRIPLVSQFLQKLGMISVNRGVLDANSVKSTLGYLKSGEKVVIFPEGTRVPEDDAVEAKAGAVKIADRTGAPIIPVFIPRKKPLFRRLPLVIGEPYYIERQTQKRLIKDYSRLSDVLMERIKSLGNVLQEES